MALTYLIIDVLALLLLAGIWIAYLILKSRKVDPLEGDEVSIEAPQYTYPEQGHAFGRLIQKTRCSTGEERITFVSTDEDFRTMTTEKPKVLQVIVPRGGTVYKPKGLYGKSRGALIVLPPRAEDLPTEVLSSPYGKMLGELIEKNNENVTDTTALREAVIRQSERFKNMAYKEISQTDVDFYRNVHKDEMQALLTAKDKRVQTVDANSTTDYGGK